MDNPARGWFFRAMKHACDILIAGGGLNGTALALACAQAGLDSLVIDPLPVARRADPGFDGRAYALALASQRLLAALGLWGQIGPEAQPILHIRTRDGAAFLDFDHAEIDEGPMGYLVEDRHLRPALLAAVADTARITHRAGLSVTGQRPVPGGIEITLSDGSTARGALLVGADGRDSPTAQRAGITRMGWGYGQTGVVFQLSHSRPHEGRAQQIFLPGGPLALLPLRGDRTALVWSEEDRAARELLSLDPADFLTVLRPHVAETLGEIALDGRRWGYPLRLSLANRIVADRLALIGDAAQGVHPIAGQGLNQGLRDVATLAQVLAEAHRRGEDPGSALVLERHRRWRSFDRAALALATDGFNRLFSNSNPLLKLGRDLGLAAVGRLPDLRRGFIREAAGLNGDLPQLLRGRPI